ncbi:MAG: maleate cis-trans isomerase family protein [Gammaproteobacteria bacterium]
MSAQFNRVEFDGTLRPAAEGGRIGVVALATDLTIERDMRRMLPPGVEMFTSRVRNANPLTPENLRAMRGDIARAAASLLPGRGVDVAIYACTSGAAVLGAETIRREMRRAHPNAPITTPTEAAVAACAALGVSRISALTPYVPEINRALEAEFAAAGRAFVNVDSLGFEDDMLVADIAPEDIVRFAKQARNPRAEALFISCTAMRAAEVAEEIENAIGIPVITSNQALAWHSLRLLGHKEKITEFGALMRTI